MSGVVLSALEKLKKCIKEGDPDGAKAETEKALEETEDVSKIVKEALVPAIMEAGELWKKNIYFLPDLVMCAEAFKESMALLEPKLSQKKVKSLGRVVIGVVSGDMHDLGKTLVAVWLRSTGFEVIDLGVDVPIETFVEKVKELKPAVVGISAYMSTSMIFIKDVIEAIRKAGLRKKVKIIVGGVTTTEKFAFDAGADAWGRDAVDAVEKVKALLGVS